MRQDKSTVIMSNCYWKPNYIPLDSGSVQSTFSVGAPSMCIIKKGVNKPLNVDIVAFTRDFFVQSV